MLTEIRDDTYEAGGWRWLRFGVKSLWSSDEYLRRCDHRDDM
jgi:hypothetical protein